MDRQLLLYEGTTQFEFILAEAVLCWRVGPPNAMLAQLDRISVLVELENVWLGIIPLDIQVDCWWEHAFELQDYRGENEAVVTVET
jgi:hypothetical protein